ncbi:ATP-binding cassette domain-containing protein [Gemella sp.]
MNKEILNMIPKSSYPKIIFYKLFLSIFNVLVSLGMQLILTKVHEKDLNGMVLISTILIVFVAFYGLIYYVYNILLEKIKKYIIENLTFRITENYLKSRDNSLKSGEFLNVVNEDVLILGDYLLYGLFPLIDFILMIAFGFIYVFAVSVKVGLFYAVVGAVIYLITKNIYKKGSNFRYEFQTRDDIHKSFYEELIKNIPILQVFNITSWIKNRDNNFYKEKATYYRKLSGVLSQSETLLTSGIYLIQVATFIGGVFLVNQGELTVPEMVGLWNVGVGSIVYQFIDIPAIVSYMIKQKSSIERINGCLKVNDENKYTFNTNSTKNILGENISFKYPKKENFVFEKLNFEIYNDKINYIVGANGSGKTTLMKILLKLLPVNYGNITYPAELNFSYVPQKSQFYNLSIKDNLTLGKDISTKEIYEILEKVNLLEKVQGLEEGLDTLINDNSFSLGQFRRLSLARAILQKADYIFLDEPFSDLDKDNQEKILTLLRKLNKNIGIVIISHTFDFIEEQDNVVKVGEQNV